MQYTVIVHNAGEGGYWVEVPSLPGCFSQGETIEESKTDSQPKRSSHCSSSNPKSAAPPSS